VTASDVPASEVAASDVAASDVAASTVPASGPITSGVTASGATCSSLTASVVHKSAFSAIGGEACCAPLPGLSVLDTSGSVPRRIRETAPVTVASPAPPAEAARTGVAVAFCPSPPLLLPAVEGRPAPETTALRAACAEAVTQMLAARPEVVVVVGDGAAPGVRFGPGDAGDLRAFGVDLTVPFSGRVRPGGRRLPLAHILGGWLLDEAGFAGTRVGVGPADLGQLVRDLPGPLGVLAIGDGSARRTAKAPGYLDATAVPFDTAVAEALAAGDATALAELDEAQGARLLAAGVPTWRAVGAALGGREISARLHLHDAPFGVGYLAATWIAS
jgi:hypothetical protein